MKHCRILITLCILALAASACVKLGGQPVEKKYYRITPVRTGEPAATKSDIVLKVRRMTVSDLYSTRELVYQMKGGRIESDFYNMFFVVPNNMLTTELRQWLATSGHFAHIVEPGSMVVPTLTLEGAINELYGDYTTEPPAAVVSMQFFMVDEATADNEIVFSRDYKQRIPLSQPDPQQLVHALTEGVQAIYTQLELDLAAAKLHK